MIKNALQRCDFCLCYYENISVILEIFQHKVSFLLIQVSKCGLIFLVLRQRRSFLDRFLEKKVGFYVKRVEIFSLQWQIFIKKVLGGSKQTDMTALSVNITPSFAFFTAECNIR